MENKRLYIPILVLSALLLTGCGVKRHMPSSAVRESEVKDMWHTCLIQGARASINVDGEQISASITMQTVRDSMLVISVIPLLGMEMVRFEATPFELIGINKIDGTYATTTYVDINRHLVPTINWDILQKLCSAELPTGKEHARLVYNMGDTMIEMTVTYPERKLDVPVRVTHLNTSRYKKIDISKWL